jgi:hypothetical protein
MPKHERLFIIGKRPLSPPPILFFFLFPFLSLNFLPPLIYYFIHMKFVKLFETQLELMWGGKNKHGLSHSSRSYFLSPSAPFFSSFLSFFPFFFFFFFSWFSYFFKFSLIQTKYVKLFETRAYVGWEDTDTGFLILVGVISSLFAAFIFRTILREERYVWAKSITLSVSFFSLLSFLSPLFSELSVANSRHLFFVLSLYS